MSGDCLLPTPEPGRWAAEAFVAEHLGHLTERRSASSESPSSMMFRGGQRAADEALARFAVDGYGRGRLDAYPQPRRTVSQLSPWIRHGLLPLSRLWDAVSAGPDTGPASEVDDRELFRTALLRQEYARHWYARLGSATTRLGQESGATTSGRREGDRTRHVSASSQWDRRLGCLEITLDELEEDGWIPDPARRWLASQRVVRDGLDWREGEEYFHRHLLDGSRASGRLGWLQVLGAAGEPATLFSRWDVEERAPGLCASCELVRECPIEQWPSVETDQPITQDPLLTSDPALEQTAGPVEPIVDRRPDAVWITAESLGDADPALAAHPDSPVIFVFDEPLLERLRLSSARLSFIVESLSELAIRRTLEIWLGEPCAVLAGRAVAATFTPVPGWRRRSARLDLAAVHPWPWLLRPHDSRIDSFGCWIDGFPSTMNEPGSEAGDRGYKTPQSSW